MEFRHLQLIRVLAQVGTLTAASKELHLTQPALSRQLSSLEKEIGVSLFHRLGKRMMLTQAGKVLDRGACRILGELKKTETDVKTIVNGRGGKLRLVTACYTCYHWLPRVLEIFRRKHPRVEISITLNATADPYSSLIEGQLDLALVNRIVSSPDLQYQPLFEDEDIVVINEKHRWNKRKYVQPEDLADENLIVFDSELKESNLFRKVLTPAGISPKQVIRLPMTETIIDMVKADLGISVMVRWAVSHHLRSSGLVPLRLTKKGIKRTWYAVTLTDPGQPAYIQHFIDLLKDNAGVYMH